MSGVTLNASRCAACGLVAAPPEPFGCERCGAPVGQLRATTIVSSGHVVASALVHRHARPEPPTPFVVVEVALDDGPMVKSQLVDATIDDATIGTRVQGRFDDTGRFSFTLAGDR